MVDSVMLPQRCPCLGLLNLGICYFICRSDYSREFIFLIDLVYFFNWTIIALQCCVSFCSTTTLEILNEHILVRRPV